MSKILYKINNTNKTLNKENYVMFIWQKSGFLNPLHSIRSSEAIKYWNKTNIKFMEKEVCLVSKKY